MRLGRFASTTVYLSMIAISATATLALYALDQQRQGTHLTAAALSSARQVAAQAEGMALTAREKGENDPVGWATSILAQGIEPRAYQIAKFSHTVPGGESYSLNRDSGIFDYVKVFAPEEGTGVRVQFATGYHGFLGTRTRVTNDLAAFAVMAVIFFILASARFVVGHPGAKRVRSAVEQWLKDAKTALSQLGIHIREMVREAQRLAVAAGKSRVTLNALRERIHGQVSRVHESRQLLHDSQLTATDAERLALNLVIEATRLGESGLPLKDKAEELHRLVLKMKGLTEKSEDAVRNLEIELEPWATDADEALHSYDDVFRASQEMQIHIRRTTEAILGQSRMLKELADEANGASATVRTATPSSQGAQVRGEIRIDDTPPPPAANVVRLAPEAAKPRAPRKRSRKSA